jgi:hypothetical protein
VADLPYIEQRQEVSIAGQDATGDQVNFVSADVNGNLFVKDYASGSATGGTAATVSSLTGGIFNTTLPTLTTGEQAALQTDSNARLLTNVAVSALPTGAATSANQTLELAQLTAINTNTASALNDTTQTGTITAVSGAVTINSQGQYSIVASISGTFVATLIVQQQNVDLSWIQVPFFFVSNMPPYTTGTNTTIPNVILILGGGYLQTRVIATSYTSGTVNVAIDASVAQQAVYAGQLGTWNVGISAGTNAIGSITNSVFGATQSGTWNITNISGTVSLPTGASTAANQATEISSLQLIDNSIGSVSAGTAGTGSNLIGLVFNTTLPTLTNGQQAAAQADSSGRLIIAPLTNTSVVKAQLQDNNGVGILSLDNQLQTADVISVAGQNRAQSVTTTAAEALGGATILANRKFLSIRPTNGTIYWGFTTGVTTTTGTPIFANEVFTISATAAVHIYVIAAATTDTRISEGS